MTRKAGPRLLIVSAAIFGSLLCVPEACSTSAQHWQSAVLHYSQLLQGGSVSRVSEAFILPASLSRGEIQSERNRLSEAITFLLREFGTMSLGEILGHATSFYEIAIGGGPKPGWWRSKYRNARSVVLDAHFGRAGRGLLKITVVEVGRRYLIAEVGFGVRSDRPGAAEEVRGMRDRFYDFLGIPKQHPLRSADLTLKRSDDIPGGT